jgi:hypothetical protein
MTHSARLRRPPWCRTTAAASALAGMTMALAGVPVARAAAEAKAGVDPLMHVALTAAHWTADGAAVVVEGLTRCQTSTTNRPTFVVTQAAMHRSPVSADAIVPDVACDGRPHAWSAPVIAPKGTPSPWHDGPATVTLSVPTTAPLLDVYTTHTFSLTRAAVISDPAITSVERQIDGLSLTVHFELHCPAGLDEVFRLTLLASQRIDSRRVLVAENYTFYVPCAGGSRERTLRIDDPGPGWDPEAPLVIDVNYDTCTDEGCTTHRSVAVRSPAPPVPDPQIVVLPHAQTVAGGSSALVRIRTRCETPGVGNLYMGLTQHVPGEVVHELFQPVQVGPCGPRLRGYTIAVPASPEESLFARQDPPQPVWHTGAAKVTFLLGPAPYGNGTTAVEDAVFLSPAPLGSSPPVVTRPRLRIDDTVYTELARTALTAIVHLTCPQPRNLTLQLTATQASSGAGQRGMGGVGPIACGPHETTVQITTGGVHRGPRWQPGHTVFLSLEARDADDLDSVDITHAWRVSTAWVGPDPIRPPAPREVDVVGIEALAAGAGAIVRVLLTCPDGPEEVYPSVQVLQPVGETDMAYFRNGVGPVDCGPTPRLSRLHVHSLESDFPSVTPPLTPGKKAVVTASVSGHGLDQRALILGPGHATDSTISPEAFIHADGAALEVDLTQTCRKAAGLAVTVDVHQVIGDGRLLQTAIEDKVLECGTDRNLAPLLITATEHPWSARPALVNIHAADCETPCAAHESVVTTSPATADPTSPDTSTQLRIVSATRHLSGAFATVTVAATCMQPTDFLQIDVEVRQPDGGTIRTGSGASLGPCDATERLVPVLLKGGTAAADFGVETHVPLRLGRSYIRAWTPFEDHIAMATRTMSAIAGAALEQMAADAALAAPPTIRARGAVLETPVRVTACDPGNHFFIVVDATQVSPAGRIHGWYNQELRFVCDGRPQTVLLHLHARDGTRWDAGPALLAAYGEVCALDFSSCTPVDFGFLETVQLGSPGTVASYHSGRTARLPAAVDTRPPALIGRAPFAARRQR